MSRKTTFGAECMFTYITFIFVTTTMNSTVLLQGVITGIRLFTLGAKILVRMGDEVLLEQIFGHKFP